MSPRSSFCHRTRRVKNGFRKIESRHFQDKSGHGRALLKMRTWAFETTLERVWELVKDGPPPWLASLFALAMVLTGFKLWRIAKLRGWIKGRTLTTETVSKKGRETLPKEQFWLSTEEGGDGGGGRIQVSKERWDRVKVGGSLEIVTVSGESDRYLADGLFTSQAQFFFDLTLFLGEAAMFAWALSRSLEEAA